MKEKMESSFFRSFRCHVGHLANIKNQPGIGIASTKCPCGELLTGELMKSKIRVLNEPKPEKDKTPLAMQKYLVTTTNKFLLTNV